MRAEHIYHRLFWSFLIVALLAYIGFRFLYFLAAEYYTEPFRRADVIWWLDCETWAWDCEDIA